MHKIILLRGIYLANTVIENGKPCKYLCNITKPTAKQEIMA
jgi:hypothetical protein